MCRNGRDCNVHTCAVRAAEALWSCTSGMSAHWAQDAPICSICQAFIVFYVAPEVRDADALDGGLHVAWVRVPALAVPVLRKVKNVAEMEAPYLPPACLCNFIAHRLPTVSWTCG